MNTISQLILTLCFTLVFNFTVVAEPLRVGILAGLTGIGAGYAKAFQTGLKLALPDGSSSADIQILFEDDQFIPKQSVAGFKKLVEFGKIDLLVVGDTSTSKAVVPLATKAKIPAIIWASEDIAFANNPYVFRTWTTMAEEAQLAKDEVTKQGYKHVVLWSGPHDYALGYGRAVSKAIAPVLADYQEFPTDLDDYRTLLASLKNKKIDALGLCLNPGQNAAVFKQMSVIGLNPSIFGCSLLNYGSDIETMKSLNLKAWSFDSKITPEFLDRYIAATGSKEMANAAAVFHDIGLVIKGISDQYKQEGQLLESFKKLGKIDGANGPFELKFLNGQQYFDFKLQKKDLP